MTCGVYSITNKKTGKMYIGQSVNIERRFRQHINSGKDYMYIDRAIKKHGEDAFDYNILLECDESKLSDEEHKFIKLFGTYKKGYNLTWGGEVSPMKCPEIVEKIRESLKGDKHYLYGKHHSKETRKKISEANKGINNHMWGKHHTEQTKNKISEVHKGKTISKETKKKMSDSHIGQNLSEQTKKKINTKKNLSGYYRVNKLKNSNCKQGIIWGYRYSDNGTRKRIHNINLKTLKENVLEKGLCWEVLDEDKAKATCDEYGYDFEELCS